VESRVELIKLKTKAYDLDNTMDGSKIKLDITQEKINNLTYYWKISKRKHNRKYLKMKNIACQ
jgi:hypothetical protein